MPGVRKRSIRKQFYIDASPKKVFRAISEPERLTRWFLHDAKLAPKKGGKYTFVWQGGYSHTGRVVEFVDGRRLTLTWPQFADDSKRLGETRLTLAVVKKGTGSLLRIEHTGFQKNERWIETYAGTHSGWAYFVMNLKSVLEHGHDLRSKHDT
jgi:uncharacterized protein YndB with AHSA1/START domain